MMACLVLSSLLIAPLAMVGAFNVGTSGASVIRGDKGTLFGSILHFLPQASKFKDPKEVALLVSAPRQTTMKSGHNVVGVIHICKDIFSSTPACTSFRQDSNKTNIQDSSENELFGFAVTANENGALVMCSPQWRDTSVRDNKGRSMYFTPGRCSLAFSPTLTDLNATKEYTPFFHGRANWRDYMGRVKKTEATTATLYYDAMAMYGFSVDSKKEHFFVAGAPGVMEGEGSVAITEWVIHKTTKLHVPKLKDYKKYNTNAAHGYLGYDVKIGKFCTGSCFAASAPNMNRVGTVKIFEKTPHAIEIIQQINGSQAWSYFGYSIAACDVNNDGWDELLVGAPHETVIGDASGHDQGRLYVYARTMTNPKLSRSQIVLEGSRKKYASFGAAVQCVDINADEYMDVAVGAPGEDRGAGSLYIYLGSGTGLSYPANQRITASSLSSGLKGLGYAISRSHYLPGFNYPVFAASSVADDAVIILRTRSIVDASVKMKAIPKLIDTTQPCPDGAITSSCFTVELCLTGSIRGGGTWDNMFNTTLVIDTNNKIHDRKRALFLKDDGLITDSIETTVDSAKDPCINYTAVIRQAQVNKDRFSPMDVVAFFSLASNTEDDTSPVLDRIQPQNTTTTVTFKNDCGDNSVCDVDLSVTGQLGYSGYSSDFAGIVVNGTKELLVDLNVTNSGETNYWTVVEIAVNSPLLFGRPTPSSDPSVVCQSANRFSDEATTTAMGETKVICNYYKPLKRDQTVNVGVTFDTFDIPMDKRTLIVTAKVTPKNNVTSQENNPSDNSAELSTDVRVIADVTVKGVSSPAQVTIQDAKKIVLDEKANLQNGYTVPDNIEELSVTHRFLIRNEGPSSLFKTTLNVTIPIFLTDASQFVNSYHVQIMSTDGDVSVCKSLRTFDYIDRIVENPSNVQTTPLPTDTTNIPTETTKTTTTDDYGWLPVINPNRRRKRSISSGRERSKFEFTEAVNANTGTYVQSCKLDPEYCQVMECDLPEGLKPNEHAEITVSLKIDKSNVPVPEDLNTFWHEVRATVIQPKELREFMDTWGELDSIGNSVTQFYLVKSDGKITIGIIVGSVLGGLVVVLIIALLLWKAGFFKREKHSQVAQREETSDESLQSVAD